MAPEMSGKQLELLKEIVPKLSRVAVLGNTSQPVYAQALREIELVADVFRVHIQSLEIRDSKDIATAFQAARKERADAVLVVTTPSSPLNEASGRPRAEEPAPNNIRQAEYVEDGGLVFYGVSYTDCSGAPLFTWTRF